MPIFLLTPVNLNMPDWRNSTVREAVQVEADTERAARRRAALFFSNAAHVQGYDAGSMPWHQNGLVSARIVNAIDPATRLILAGDTPD